MDNNSKSLIIAELALIFAGGLVAYQARTKKPWPDTLIDESPRAGLATAMLGIILLLMADVGAGKEAAAFGGLISLGFLIRYSADLSAGINSITKKTLT